MSFSAQGFVVGIVHFNSFHEHIQIYRVCYFCFYGVFFALKGSKYSELQLAFCRVTAVKCHPVQAIFSGPLESFTSSRVILKIAFCESRCHGVCPTLHISLLN